VKNHNPVMKLYLTALDIREGCITCPEQIDKSIKVDNDTALFLYAALMGGNTKYLNNMNKMILLSLGKSHVYKEMAAAGNSHVFSELLGDPDDSTLVGYAVGGHASKIPENTDAKAWPRICGRAAKYGRINVLEKARKLKVQVNWDNIITGSASCRVDFFLEQWARGHGLLKDPDVNRSSALLTASLDMKKEMDRLVLWRQAAFGNLEFLMEYSEHHVINVRTQREIVEGGIDGRHTHVLEWCDDMKYPLPHKANEKIFDKDDDLLAPWLARREGMPICLAATFFGRKSARIFKKYCPDGCDRCWESRGMERPKRKMEGEVKKGKRRKIK